LMTVACAGLALMHTLPGLLVFTAVLGIGHLMLVISQQVLCARDPTPGAIERMIGNYMVANAVGQAVGPYLVGWAGGDASIPPTQFLFRLPVVPAPMTLGACLLLRSSAPPSAKAKERTPVPVREIPSIPGIRVLFFLSVVTVAAQDLVVVYLPVLGSERGMPV